MTRPRRRSSAEPKATEAELLQLLERRHAKQGNGGSGEFAFLTHVRNDGGFSATRTFDAVAVSLWPSRGHAIDVFERDAGVQIQPRAGHTTEADVAATARRIRTALADEGHADRVRQRLERMRDDLQHAAAQIDQLVNHPDQRPTLGRVN